jgi:hypothetical protein
MRTPRRQSLALILLFLTGSLLAGCVDNGHTLDARFTATPLDAAKTQFRFEATASNGKSPTYTWDFGDRTTPGIGPVVEHTYAHPDGEYLVRLTLTGPDGTADASELPVQVGTAPNHAPLLYLRADRRLAAPAQEVLFDASQSLDADGDPLFFQWDFNSKREQREFDGMENLGNHQYGRYPNGKPAPADRPTRADDPSADGLTPSGHDWHAEFEQAQRRALDRAGITRLDGDHSVKMEPRNADLDGVVDDQGPIQLFSFPSPATYFVHVRVEDIKGAAEEGFIRIRVQDVAPPTSNQTRLADRLEPQALAPAQEQTTTQRIETSIGYTFLYEHAGDSNLTLTYQATPQEAGAKVALYVCGAKALSTCTDGAPLAKLEAGASGRGLEWSIGPGASFPFPYTLFVANEGPTLVDFDFVVSSRFDLNPWAQEEAGLAPSH